MITIQDAKKYIKNWENINEFFTKEAINGILSHAQLSDFVTKQDVPTQSTMNAIYEKKGYYKESETPLMQSVTEYSNHNGGGWSRIITTPCYTWLIPNKYQLKEANLLKEGLLIDFPYLKDFNFCIYHFDNPATIEKIEKHKERISYPWKKEYFGMEMYVDVNDSETNDTPLFLYVPLIALREKNVDIIINRHTRYHESYYGKYSNKDKYLAMAMSALTKTKAIKLFDAIKK